MPYQPSVQSYIDLKTKESQGDRGSGIIRHPPIGTYVETTEDYLYDYNGNPVLELIPADGRYIYRGRNPELYDVLDPQEPTTLIDHSTAKGIAYCTEVNNFKGFTATNEVLCGGSFRELGVNSDNVDNQINNLTYRVLDTNHTEDFTIAYTMFGNTNYPQSEVRIDDTDGDIFWYTTTFYQDSGQDTGICVNASITIDGVTTNLPAEYLDIKEPTNVVIKYDSTVGETSITYTGRRSDPVTHTVQGYLTKPITTIKPMSTSGYRRLPVRNFLYWDEYVEDALVYNYGRILEEDIQYKVVADLPQEDWLELDYQMNFDYNLETDTLTMTSTNYPSMVDFFEIKGLQGNPSELGVLRLKPAFTEGGTSSVTVQCEDQNLVFNYEEGTDDYRCRDSYLWQLRHILKDTEEQITFISSWQVFEQVKIDVVNIFTGVQIGQAIITPEDVWQNYDGFITYSLPLADGSVIDQEMYPEVWDVYWDGISENSYFPNMPTETGSPFPYKIVSDYIGTLNAQ